MGKWVGNAGGRPAFLLERIQNPKHGGGMSEKPDRGALAKPQLPALAVPLRLNTGGVVCRFDITRGQGAGPENPDAQVDEFDVPEALAADKVALPPELPEDEIEPLPSGLRAPGLSRNAEVVQRLACLFQAIRQRLPGGRRESPEFRGVGVGQRLQPFQH